MEIYSKINNKVSIKDIECYITIFNIIQSREPDRITRIGVGEDKEVMYVYNINAIQYYLVTFYKNDVHIHLINRR